MNNPTNPSNLPLARAFTLKQLSGWLGKALDVPHGRQGISMNAAGRMRLFPPGRQRVLSVFERLAGHGAGLRAGFVPTQGFQASLKAPNLLSGDNELLDASLLCQVEVTDPPRFFTELVIPQGQVDSGLIDLSEVLSIETIGALAARYAARDLVSGLSTQRLATELFNVLQPALSGLGLRLVNLQWIVFWRAEKRVEIAEKAQALDDRLKELVLDKEMAALERQAKREDFIRQFQEEVEARPVAVETPTTGSAAPTPPPVENMRGWLTIDTAKEGGKRHWRFEDLFNRRKKPPEEGLASRRQLKRWVKIQIIFLLGLSSLGCLSTVGFFWIAKAASWNVKWEFFMVIWGPVLGVLMGQAVVFFKKREDLDDLFWQSKGITEVDDLSRNNRQRADQLVREQCAEDMRHVQEILSDVQQRVYGGERAASFTVEVSGAQSGRTSQGVP
jgi:hypothetical protein